MPFRRIKALHALETSIIVVDRSCAAGGVDEWQYGVEEVTRPMIAGFWLFTVTLSWPPLMANSLPNWRLLRAVELHYQSLFLSYYCS